MTQTTIHLLPIVSAGFLLTWASVAHGAEAQDKERATAILKRFEAANTERWKLPEEFRPSYKSFIEDVAKTLGEDEIRFLGTFRPESDLNEAVFRKWASFDHESALRAAREEEERLAARIRLAGKGTEGGVGEAESAHVFVIYLGAVDGWAKVDPKSAWENFKKREGPFAKSLVIEDYLTYFYKSLFTHLAGADPGLAFDELVASRADELCVSTMLLGYSRGAPRGLDWAGHARRLLERKWEHESVYGQIRCALLGRWLEDDPEGAEKWFREGDVEHLNWSSEFDGSAASVQASGAKRGPRGEIHQRFDLGEAAGFWAGRDLPSAWAWMKSCDGLDRDGFERSVLRGVTASLGEEPFGDPAIPRVYLLTQIAAMPEQADRDKLVLRFASELWVYDGIVATNRIDAPKPPANANADHSRSRRSTKRCGWKASGRTFQCFDSAPRRRARRSRNSGEQAIKNDR